MTRDIPVLPWSEPYRLWFCASVFAAAIAASAVYGVIGWWLKAAPEPFTTDQEGKS